MAKCEVKLPDDLLEKLSKLGSGFDDAAERVLQAGANVVCDTVKGKLSAVVGHNTKHKSRSTGRLVASLGISPVKLGNDGNHNIKVGFSEGRPDGVSNAMLANLLEYGKSNQPAKPFLKPAKSASKGPCLEAMKAQMLKELEHE